MEKTKPKTKEVKSKGSSKKADPGETSKNEALLKSKLKEKQAKSGSDTDDDQRGKDQSKKPSKGKLFGKKNSDATEKDKGGVFRRKSKTKGQETEEKPVVIEKESTEKELASTMEKFTEKFGEKVLESKEEKKEPIHIPSVKKPSITNEEKSIISEALHQIENAAPVNPVEIPITHQVPDIVSDENVSELKMTTENKTEEMDVEWKQQTQQMMAQVAEPEDYVSNIMEDIAKQAVEEKPAENEDDKRYL